MKCCMTPLPCREQVETGPVPSAMIDSAVQARHELIGCLADVDEEIAEFFLNDRSPTLPQIKVSKNVSKLKILSCFSLLDLV